MLLRLGVMSLPSYHPPVGQPGDASLISEEQRDVVALLVLAGLLDNVVQETETQ